MESAFSQGEGIVYSALVLQDFYVVSVVLPLISRKASNTEICNSASEVIGDVKHPPVPRVSQLAGCTSLTRGLSCFLEVESVTTSKSACGPGRCCRNYPCRLVVVSALVSK